MEDISSKRPQQPAQSIRDAGSVKRIKKGTTEGPQDEIVDLRERRTNNSTVAYLCMEFAVDESLQLYAGGLGILAGDVVKTARDRNLPLCGVGILWDQGYSEQHLDTNGRQSDKFPPTDRSCFEQVKLPHSVTAPLGDEEIELIAYTVKGYGDKLYLLEPKDIQHRHVTRRLYQGSGRDRLAQEMILGVGGVRLMKAIKKVDYFHFNEGHAVFAGFELIREAIAAPESLPFKVALMEVRSQCRFTTHTPVAAGNEKHSMEDVMAAGVAKMGFTKEQVETIGGNPFGMTVAAFHLSGKANAVAQLHRETSANMWKRLTPTPEVIGITNGVHVQSWQDSRIRHYFDRELRQARRLNEPVVAPKAIDEDALWAVHQQCKKELIEEVERRSGVKLSLDALLIGFARRAATYKRHTLLFRQAAQNLFEKEQRKKETALEIAAEEEEEEGTVTNPKNNPKEAVAIPAEEQEIVQHMLSGRLQALYSGKAHPQDEEGKDQVQLLFMQQMQLDRGLLYLPNYDMKLGRLLTRGVDIWLNNPIRPMEASGTSGQKAAMNGVLNCSILDGWWPEMCVDGANGWQLGEGESTPDGSTQEAMDGAERRDAKYLHDTINKKILPCYEEEGKLVWRKMMRQSILGSMNEFSSERMMEDYMHLMYID